MELDRFARTYAELKRERNIFDFSDMLVQATGTPLDVDVAFVDEAQDLSLAQWELVKSLVPNVRRIVVAGDDDQAIYRWAGASVNTFLFLGREYPTTVLKQSYRLPREVWQFATVLASNIQDRLPKDWSPRDGAGSVHRRTYLDEMPLGEGSWLVLARNRVFLRQVADYLREQGYAYSTQAGDSVRPEHANAIRAHVMLGKGEHITAAKAKTLFKFIPGKDVSTIGTGKYNNEVLQVNTRKPWFEVLSRISMSDRTYYRALLKRYGRLRDLEGPRLGTIHSVKGGEADHVLLLEDQTAATWENAQRNPDDEARVWYVGATRAKESLWLLQGDGEYAKRL
jgi:DNA helicase-2/ATP-dependent DNA helicase PcrA